LILNASLPTAVLKQQVLQVKALCPTAVLQIPATFEDNATLPIAVFCCPVVLEAKAFCPTATLKVPEVLAVKALVPIAVLLAPVKLPSSKAPSPKATLLVPTG
jgi:hypothetical protein